MGSLCAQLFITNGILKYPVFLIRITGIYGGNCRAFYLVYSGALLNYKPPDFSKIFGPGLDKQGPACYTFSRSARGRSNIKRVNAGGFKK